MGRIKTWIGRLAFHGAGDLLHRWLRNPRIASLMLPDLRHKVLGFRLSGTPIYTSPPLKRVEGFRFLSRRKLTTQRTAPRRLDWRDVQGRLVRLVLSGSARSVGPSIQRAAIVMVLGWEGTPRSLRWS